MEDETVVRKLLNAIPDRYLQIVASIEQYSDLSEMTMEEAIGRLKTYEERIKNKWDKQVNSQESLMCTQHEGKRKPFREYGHGRFNYESTAWSAEIAKNGETARSAEIAESAKIAESVETIVSEYRRQQGVQKIQKLISVTVSVKGSKDEDK
nr:zinc finger, CCHC-type [Tanacetum cinerariifolium]